MKWPRPEKAAFEIHEDADGVTVACQYWKVRHARCAGGNIAEVTFPHGSGKNIFAAPCSTHMGLGDIRNIYTYSNVADESPELSAAIEGDGVRVVSVSALIDERDDRLSVTVRHTYTHHPWGYVRQRVEIAGLVKDVIQVSIGQPTVANHLDEFGYRPGLYGAGNWKRDPLVHRWQKLHAGASVDDTPVAYESQLPLYFSFLKRGVEGFGWFLGENLDQWYRQLIDIPDIGQFRVDHDGDVDGYVVRLCPMDHWCEGVDLAGPYTFDFFMGLPFVHQNMPTTVCSMGGLLERKIAGGPTCFPSAGEVGLDAEVARRSMDYFGQALELATDDAVRLRVEKASLCACRAMIGTEAWKDDDEKAGLVDQYIALCQGHGMTRAAEHKTADEYFEELRTA